ncbi:MAG: serine O-acetyltransferase EpsC [Myxococcales bacterium]
MMMSGQFVRDLKAIACAEFGSDGGRQLGRALLLDAVPILAMTRIRESARRWRVPLVNRALRLVQMAVYGVEIGKDVTLGDGVSLVHSLGTVIGGTSQLGKGVRLMGNNTIGSARDDGCPVLEDKVIVGAGARVLGPIRVGAGAIIGANAVVVRDVPAGDVVVGCPARSTRRSE